MEHKMPEMKQKKVKSNKHMPESKAKIRATILQRLVKHPELSYRPVRISEFGWAVGQFFGEDQVGLVV